MQEQEVEIRQPQETIEPGPNPLVEVPFTDQNGEDLGTFWVDPEQKIGELVREIVEESGLPTKNPNGSPRRYEAYRKDRKLPASTPLREVDISGDESIEIYPSVVTGSVA
jgi:hypothetical protein